MAYSNEAQRGSSFFGVMPLLLLLALGTPSVFGTAPESRGVWSDTTGAALVPPPLPELEALPRATLQLTPDFEIVELPPPPPPPVFLEPGEASYYHDALSGNPTASGEPYDPDALTAAHRTLPLGTRVRVTNLHNGKSVEVLVNDRGPFIDGRVIDLSFAAARKIGMVRRGVADVHVHLLPTE